MCLFVHFLDLNDQFYVQGFNGTDFWSDFKTQESMLHYGMLLRAFFGYTILLFVENDYLNKAEEIMKDPLLAWMGQNN